MINGMILNLILLISRSLMAMFLNGVSENATKIKVNLFLTGSMTYHTRKGGVLVHLYFRNDIGCVYWSRCAK